MKVTIFNHIKRYFSKLCNRNKCHGDLFISQPIHEPVPISTTDAQPVSPTDIQSETSESTQLEISINAHSKSPESGQLPSTDLITLCKELAQMVKMYDQMAKQMPEGETRDLVEDFTNQIITTLSLSPACTTINNEPFFSSQRHIPIPFDLIDDGTPIKSTIRLGIAIGEQIIIPAKVKI